MKVHSTPTMELWYLKPGQVFTVEERGFMVVGVLPRLKGIVHVVALDTGEGYPFPENTNVYFCPDAAVYINGGELDGQDL